MNHTLKGFMNLNYVEIKHVPYVESKRFGKGTSAEVQKNVERLVVQAILTQRRPMLGNTAIEEVYIYPPVASVARRVPPQVKITGVKRIVRGTETEEVSEVVGYVEGFIGEADFNNKFAELIKSKFGTTEQFGVTYPRIILEEADRL